jgi:hypothetical protein
MRDEEFRIGFLHFGVRRNDLPFAVLLAIPYWASNALINYLLRLLKVAGNDGRIGSNPFTEPDRIILGIVSHMVILFVILYLQSSWRSENPSGSTLRLAVLPTALIGLLSILSSSFVVRESGSIVYAGITNVVFVATTFVVSLLLQKVRRFS